RRGRGAASPPQDRGRSRPRRALFRPDAVPPQLYAGSMTSAGSLTTDVLLTGFAPFDGAGVNESWEAARLAAPALRAEGMAVVERELPVECGRASRLLAEAVRELRPRLVIAVGLAAGRSALTPERVAVNIRDARIPDGAGARPIDEPVVPG